MALDAMWAVLNSEVSGVSGVQARIYGGLHDTPAFFAEVSEVSSTVYKGHCVAVISGKASSDTPLQNQRYHAQPAWALGRTPDTPATPKKFNLGPKAANELLLGDLLTTEHKEPKRIFRQRGPWLTVSEKSAARAYHAHHFKCRACIAAGQGNRYGSRCAIGLALWNTYSRIETTG
jgi:hypothetical protein